METHFEIDFNLVVLNTLIEQSDQNTLITVGIIAMCKKEKRSGLKVNDPFLAFNMNWP